MEDNAGTKTARKIELTEQNYDVVTLRAQIETQLNGTGKTVTGNYTVTHITNRNTYVISLSGGTFRFMSEDSLNYFDGRSDWIMAGGAVQDPWNGCDGLLGLRGVGNLDTTFLVYGNAIETGSIDIRNLHQLFLHSSTLTSYNTSGPLGTRSCLCRIPITSQFGMMVWKQHSGLLHDYFDCGGVSAQVLRFSLRDSYNKEVHLQGGGVSFTLLFVEQPII